MIGLRFERVNLKIDSVKWRNRRFDEDNVGKDATVRVSKALFSVTHSPSRKGTFVAVNLDE